MMGGNRRVYRCSEGHLFSLNWRAARGISVIKLGFAGYMRCPVGSHWSLVKAYYAELTEEERQTLNERERHDDQEMGKLNGSILVFLGLCQLVYAAVAQNWWLAAGGGVGVALGGVLFIRARR